MTSIGIFACSHLWLLTLNRTTIENIQFRAWNHRQKQNSTSMVSLAPPPPPPPMFTHSGKCIFNQGTTTNWIEMMGDHWLYWFCKFVLCVCVCVLYNAKRIFHLYIYICFSLCLLYIYSTTECKIKM